MTKLEQLASRHVDEDDWADKDMMLDALRELREELAKEIGACFSSPLVASAIRAWGEE